MKKKEIKRVVKEFHEEICGVCEYTKNHNYPPELIQMVSTLTGMLMDKKIPMEEEAVELRFLALMFQRAATKGLMVKTFAGEMSIFLQWSFQVTKLLRAYDEFSDKYGHLQKTSDRIYFNQVERWVVACILQAVRKKI